MTIRRLHRKFIRQNSAKNENIYKNAKREYQKMIRENKNRYYKEQFDIHKRDSHKIWMLINECLNRKSKKDHTHTAEKMIFGDITYETEQDIASQFNLFNNHIALEICEKIEKPRYPPEYYLEKCNQPTEPLELMEVTKEEDKIAVMSLGNKSSTGPDQISNKLLKKIVPYILSDLT